MFNSSVPLGRVASLHLHPPKSGAPFHTIQIIELIKGASLIEGAFLQPGKHFLLESRGRFWRHILYE
jgi:hypothetical protein